MVPFGLNYFVYDVKLHIDDSYKIVCRKDMKEFIEWVKVEHAGRNLHVLSRDTASMCREWAAHNLLYELGIYKSHAKDVDFDLPEDPWHYKFAYWVLNAIYRVLSPIFKRRHK